MVSFTQQPETLRFLLPPLLLRNPYPRAHPRGRTSGEFSWLSAYIPGILSLCSRVTAANNTAERGPHTASGTLVKSHCSKAFTQRRTCSGDLISSKVRVVGTGPFRPGYCTARPAFQGHRNLHSASIVKRPSPSCRASTAGRCLLTVQLIGLAGCKQ